MDSIGLQAELTLRLLVAAALGAVIGLERELANHPAGMRTHLLVSLGSALFAVVSAYGYASVFTNDPEAVNNPQRIAAQIVTGIGFLGAGAIIQAGRWVRGMTTAASLWATAAVGLAVGSGEYVMGVAGMALVVVSLGPLHRLVARVRRDGPRVLRLRLELATLESLGRVTEAAVSAGSEVVGLECRKLGKGRYEVEIQLRRPIRVVASQLVAMIAGVSGVEVSDASDVLE